MNDSVVLARAVASPRERRAATLMAGLFVALLVFALPWVHGAGPAVPAVVAVFTTGVVIADFATTF